MYRPPHFRVDELDDVAALIDQIPTAQIVIHLDGQLDSALVPVIVDHHRGPHGTVRAHVAKANPIAQADGAEVLVLWTGAQAYISPSAYPSKREHGKVVPTWNYVVVQGRGRLRMIDDPLWLTGLVGALTDRHEKTRNEPWAIEDAPVDYIEAMIGAIRGVEIELTSIEAKAKVSQNRSTADQDGVMADLHARGEGASAALVQRFAP